VSCPALILYAVRTHSLALVLYLIAAAAGLLSVLLLYISLDARAATPPKESNTSAPSTNLFVIVALCALFFIYVGNETCISGWSAAFTKRLDVPGGARWVLAPTFFLAALLGGRGLASVILLRVKEHWVAICGLILSSGGNFFLLRSTSTTQAIASVTVIGLGLSSLYPIYIAWLSKWFGARARKVGGFLFSFGALGGAIPPWLVGIVSTHAGGLQYGFLVPLISSVSMLLIVGMLRKQFRT
jgi:FHS family glucose/mannose:H+ symporter-like MFS transporter